MISGYQLTRSVDKTSFVVTYVNVCRNLMITRFFLFNKMLSNTLLASANRILQIQLQIYMKIQFSSLGNKVWLWQILVDAPNEFLNYFDPIKMKPDHSRVFWKQLDHKQICCVAYQLLGCCLSQFLEVGCHHQHELVLLLAAFRPKTFFIHVKIGKKTIWRGIAKP